MRSDSEWKSVIEEAQASIKPPYRKYETPTTTTSALAATYIDHTQLKLDATDADIDKLCAEAREHGFAAVCVRLNHVSRAVANLTGAEDINIACVIGFHEGTQSLEEKSLEAKAALKAGATELDIVLNRDLLKAGAYTKVYEELSALRELAPWTAVRLKLIFETSQLSRDEIIAAGVLAAYARFDFIKTSTGFSGRGASLGDVGLMAAIAEHTAQGTSKSRYATGQKKLCVKASGGIRTFEDSLRMIEEGAMRIGTSNGVKIVQEAKEGEQLSTANSGDQSKEDGDAY